MYICMYGVCIFSSQILLKTYFIQNDRQELYLAFYSAFLVSEQDVATKVENSWMTVVVGSLTMTEGRRKHLYSKNTNRVFWKFLNC